MRTFVTLFLISLSGMFNPSLAAVYASGYPVALLASAELRDRRALTSMMQYSLLVGLSAYWMLHSPTTPRCRMTLIAVVR